MISQVNNYIKDIVQIYYVIFMCTGQCSTKGLYAFKEELF